MRPQLCPALSWGTPEPGPSEEGQGHAMEHWLLDVPPLGSHGADHQPNPFGLESGTVCSQESERQEGRLTDSGIKDSFTKQPIWITLQWCSRKAHPCTQNCQAAFRTHFKYELYTQRKLQINWTKYLKNKIMPILHKFRTWKKRENFPTHFMGPVLL